MLNIVLHKMDRTGVHCAHPECKKNPKYMVNILGSVWYIRVDTTVAVVTVGGSRAEYYCRECIDELFNEVRTKLDSKLWAFH